MVRRSSWHFADTFVFRQVPAEIPREVVPKMQSLPSDVKAEFERRFNSIQFQMNSIYYDNQLAIVGPSNLIEGYAPSVSDLNGEDWEIYNPQ